MLLLGQQCKRCTNSGYYDYYDPDGYYDPDIYYGYCDPYDYYDPDSYYDYDGPGDYYDPDGYQDPDFASSEMENIVENLYRRISEIYYGKERKVKINNEREDNSNGSHEKSLCRACKLGICDRKD
ncbi:unnamed protein product [Didymodactylos carnosus]|uniref:3CxxC-type domain-containing protein n=1 Tax=Didymodactylos carnosus TaxID=1234261 RepID=A0A816CTP4_9BILA|nr:unnamed protein product [Didymodactylos carnosus]CAF4521451.1 unnamed protein product [Didymodactylos carnosus]